MPESRYNPVFYLCLPFAWIHCRNSGHKKIMMRKSLFFRISVRLFVAYFSMKVKRIVVCIYCDFPVVNSL